ncbi:hypothetical protein ACWFMI_19895 [Nocardiopsis terrae]
MAVIAGRVFARPKPPTEAMIANRARVRWAAQARADYEAAIARELAVRGEAHHLFRTQGASEEARYAALVHLRAEAARTAAGNTLFELRAHRSVSA